MTILALVPARGGSKRVPHKNLALCAGRPLLAWTALAVAESRTIDRAILSTDDPEIARVGESLGLEVPFLRPAALARDETGMIGVMQHALEWAAGQGIEIEALVLLQPTSPLRRGQHIEEAVRAFRDSGAATVVSVIEVNHSQHPAAAYRLTEGRLEPYIKSGLPLDNGAPPRAFARNGPAILINRPEVVASGERWGQPLMPYIMADEDSVDIDTPLDLAFAEFLLRRRGEPGS